MTVFKIDLARIISEIYFPDQQLVRRGLSTNVYIINVNSASMVRSSFFTMYNIVVINFIRDFVLHLIRQDIC